MIVAAAAAEAAPNTTRRIVAHATVITLQAVCYQCVLLLSFLFCFFLFERNREPVMVLMVCTILEQNIESNVDRDATIQIVTISRLEARICAEHFVILPLLFAAIDVQSCFYVVYVCVCL